MKDTFIVYTSYLERFANLSDQQLGTLFRAMLEYQSSGVAPQINDMAVSFCFDVVKYDMDVNNDKYEETCRKRKEAGALGGKQRVANVSKSKQMLPFATKSKQIQHDTDSDSESDSVSDSESVTDTDVLTDKQQKEDTIVSKKETKHKYGMYDNVLLTDTEFSKLKEEFPRDWQDRIERLSEYIESKGAKYKNHLATIRAWARKDTDTAKAKKRTPFSVIDDMDFSEPLNSVWTKGVGL